MTTEIEHVNIDGMKRLEEEGRVGVFPSSQCIANIQVYRVNVWG